MIICVIHELTSDNLLTKFLTGLGLSAIGIEAKSQPT